MDIEEHFKHAHRRQVITLNGHLLNARKCIMLGSKYAKNIGKQSEICKVIEANVDALFDGLNETVQLCADAANEFKDQMKEPNAVPAPTFGKHRRFALTRLQRIYEKEGRVSFDTIQSHERVKPHTFAPKQPLKFNIIKTKQKNRKRNRKEGRIPI